MGELTAFVKTTKGILTLILIGVIAFAGWRLYASYKADMTELDSLRDQKIAWDAREEVSKGIGEAFQKALDARAQTAATVETRRIYIENRVKEVAHEDPTVAEYLAQPIPLRLRELDREAEEQR